MSKQLNKYYFPTSLQQRGFISFDEKAPANGSTVDGQTPPAHLQPGRAEQVAPVKEKPVDQKALDDARKREIAEGVKSQTREERAARLARELDEDEEFGQLVTSKRTKAVDDAASDELKKEVEDLKRDRALYYLAEEHGLAGEDAKKFRKLLSRYSVDELDAEAKDIAELIKGAAGKGRRRDEDEDEEPAPRGRQASTARVPSRDGSEANMTEDQRLEHEFRRLSRQEARAK